MADSSVDLCVQTAIDHVRKLGDVGNINFQLLERVLPHCTLDQLRHIEKSTRGRDLRPITDVLWKNFFERQFGAKKVDLAVQKMKEKADLKLSWRQLYEEEEKQQEETEKMSGTRMRERYKNEEAKKRSRQIVVLDLKSAPTATNTTGHKRSCPSTKNNLMKKARLEFVKEIKYSAAMKIKIKKASGSGSLSCNK